MICFLSVCPFNTHVIGEQCTVLPDFFSCIKSLLTLIIICLIIYSSTDLLIPYCLIIFTDKASEKYTVFLYIFWFPCNFLIFFFLSLFTLVSSLYQISVWLFVYLPAYLSINYIQLSICLLSYLLRFLYPSISYPSSFHRRSVYLNKIELSLPSILTEYRASRGGLLAFAGARSLEGTAVV